MPKFFQSEIAAYDGDRQGFQNVKFKKGSLQNSSAAQGGGVLEIIPVHIKNPPVIQFMAYITQLNERYSAKFTPEQPFGRTNPYYLWQANDRSITIGIDLPSSGISSAFNNLNNLSWLLASLYPSYKDSFNATSIAASPLFRVRYGNLICSSTRDGQGLLCVIDGVSVNHSLENGVLTASPKNLGSSFANAAGQILTAAGFHNHLSENKKFIIPKLMKLSMTLKVVHDHALGWDFNTGEFRGGRSAPSFPYDFGLVRESTDPPPSKSDSGGSSASANSSGASPTSVESKVNTKAAGHMNASTDLAGTPASAAKGEGVVKKPAQTPTAPGGGPAVKPM